MNQYRIHTKSEGTVVLFAEDEFQAQKLAMFIKGLTKSAITKISKLK